VKTKLALLSQSTIL